MAFTISSSPHDHAPLSTPVLMRRVCYCLLPGIAMQWWFFGWGSLVQIALAVLTAYAAEGLVLKLRHRSLTVLQDNSALLTALLIGVAMPPLAPWWMVVIGTAFAIIIAKQLYGGLGQNIFNPAMVAYVLLLVSFPLHMTSWLPPLELQQYPPGLADSLSAIFTGYTLDGFSPHQLRELSDGTTMATPLDTLKTGFTQGLTASEVLNEPVFGGLAGIGWQWVNLAYLAGGIALLRLRLINWAIPVSLLTSLAVLSFLGFMISPDNTAGPLIQLFSGATMIGAFFIATDPVSASTTFRGRLIYGALIGLLIYLIRTFGGYPDAIAFAVLLANLTVPMIDSLTKPATYGERR
ncbi:electron transport complex subunit RsxD [Oceanimonas baumannii]|uniref:Ion-translocating oxidoreductase complex subunit D n=1 Tax=Oceanimonas baumannii TaxID=129578 RepID=A0A235CAB8_9GAMM|nr:electron transport complex subunit RsxD [Oceanimonas baumannii]OYD21384.1 electron transport complex subunit RsxD [Oceanimonas baumannii]TDW56398.1 electron transport complex protein RnfD [Oceanimonas baumannii]